VLVTLLYRVFDGALGLTDRTYPTGPLDVVLHLLLLHTLYIKTFWSWTGASWNLGLEWTWYWLFFIPVWLFRKNGPWIAVAIMSAVTVAWMICLRIFAGPMNSMSQVQWMVLHDTVPGRFMEFGLGMLVAWWLANRTINRRMVAVCYAAVVLGMLAGELRPPVDYGIRPLLYAVTFTFALLAAAAPGRNVIRSIFSFYPLRWVGQCSYSLYLFHLPFVLLLSNVYMRLTGSPVRSFFLDLISIPAIVLVAHCSYLVFEKPFMSVRPRPAVQSAAAAVATT
jgi:peptidoglycan/LPS O-acetylase OafA/YrhL